MFKEDLLCIKAAVALALAAGVFCCCAHTENSAVSTDDSLVARAYDAIPPDALLIADFESLDDILSLSDPLTFGFIDTSSPLVRFQRRLANIQGVGQCHTLLSLHYIARNETSFLQVTDLTSTSASMEEVVSLIDSLSRSSQLYNGYKVREMVDGMMVTVAGMLVIASNSAICLESSLRHLVGGMGIAVEREFCAVAERCGAGYLYLNHKRTDKLFLGSTRSGFLKYSDFVTKYATWSALRMNINTKGIISLMGESVNHRDAKYFSSIVLSQKPTLSEADKILPGSTMYCVAVQIPAMNSYLKGYRDYLDANKRLRGYRNNLSTVALANEKSPFEWLSDSGYTEVLSALCLIDNEYEWVTLARKKRSFMKRLFDSKSPVVVEDFKFKGYFKALLGEAFSHTSEESFCTIGEWTIIGSQRCVSSFARGEANEVTLESYLRHTPAAGFFNERGNVKVLINIGEGETLLDFLNDYYKERLAESVRYNNFEYATLNITTKKGCVLTDMTLYLSTLATPPAMFPEVEACTGGLGMQVPQIPQGQASPLAGLDFPINRVKLHPIIYRREE